MFFRQIKKPLKREDMILLSTMYNNCIFLSVNNNFGNMSASIWQYNLWSGTYKSVIAIISCRYHGWQECTSYLIWLLNWDDTTLYICCFYGSSLSRVANPTVKLIFAGLGYMWYNRPHIQVSDLTRSTLDHFTWIWVQRMRRWTPHVVIN